MFTLPGCVRASTVALVGEFNNWSRDANVMALTSEGDWTVTVALAPGRYRFRYVADDDRWLNDWAADDYVPNAFGGEDSVVLVARPSESRRDAAEPLAGFGRGLDRPPLDRAASPIERDRHGDHGDCSEPGRPTT